MCGIAGVFFKTSKLVARLPAFRRLIEAHQHTRGPDGFGEHRPIEGVELHLFHTMLAIIDPGRATQPMTDDAGAITFNGEIYNYRDLKLPDETYRLKSDTEVLLKGLNRHGVDFLSRVTGMFAFAHLDRRTRRLTIARDRIGERQVYYIDTPDMFAFASTITPLMAFSSAVVDQRAVADYYFNRAIKAPRTIFTDICEVEPGCSVTFDVASGALAKPSAWWRLPNVVRTVRREAEAIEQIDSLLRSAVRHCLVADVPVGAFLSGGVDSSLIVAMAAEQAPNLEVFSVGMNDPRRDETEYARAVAQRYGLKHHVLMADPHEFLDSIEGWALLQDDVVADPSALMLHKLSQMVSQAGFKVMLSGEGADEAFAGYNSTFRYAMSKRYYKLFAPLRPFRGGIDRLLAGRSKMRQFAHQLLTEPAYYGVATIFEPIVLDRLLIGAHDAPRSVGSLGEALQRDLRDRLPNDLLTRTDRATLGASVEVRVPFLAHELVTYSLAIDERLLLKNNTQKYLLKKLAERYVPHTNIYRRKLGFDLPLAEWLRGPLRERLDHCLATSRQGALIDLDYVREVAGLHQQRRIDASDKLWAFMLLEYNLARLDEVRAGALASVAADIVPAIAVDAVS